MIVLDKTQRDGHKLTKAEILEMQEIYACGYATVRELAQRYNAPVAAVRIHVRQFTDAHNGALFLQKTGMI